MALATLSIDLVAKIASFEKDLKHVANLTEQQANAINRSFGVATAGLAGLASALSAGMAVSFVRQTINGIDALNDLKDATGASIENLSALEDIAIRSGNSFDAVSGSLVRFNKVLLEAKPGSAMENTLKAIGLSADAMRRIDPAEALRLTAVALSRYADDGNKARLIQELFGKSIREAGPWLKDLAEAGQLNAKVTAEQAQKAEDFNKALASIQKNSTDASRAIVLELMPSVMRLSDEFVVGMNHANGLIDAILTFGTLNPFRSQTGNMQALREDLDELGKARERYVRAGSDTSGLDDAILKTRRQLDYLKELQARQVVRESASVDVSDALSRRLGRDRPSAPLPRPATKDGKSARTDAAAQDLAAYVKSLDSAIQKELDLTEVEKARIFLSSLGYTGEIAQVRELVLGMAQLIDLDREQAERIKDRRALVIAEGEAVNQANEKYQALIKSLLDGGPEAQLEKQRQAMQALAAEFERGAITAAQFSDAATGFLGLDKKIEKTKSVAEELGLSFSSALEDAIVEGRNFSDVIKGIEQDIMRIVTRKLVTEPLANMATNFITSAFGFADGGVMTSSGPLPLRRYASGGVASSPQVALFGEGSTPEAFVPLPDGRRIPVAMKGGGGNTYHVNVEVAPPPGSSRQTANQWGAEVGRHIQRSLSRVG